MFNFAWYLQDSCVPVFLLLMFVRLKIIRYPGRFYILMIILPENVENPFFPKNNRHISLISIGKHFLTLKGHSLC